MNLSRSSSSAHHARSRAFTLMELMLAAGIMALILVAAVPSLDRLLRKEGFRKTVSDVKEACESARSQAIRQGKPTTIVIQPGDRSIRGGTTPVRFEEGVTLRMLFVNHRECTTLESVPIRFYQNGTCDEMKMVLSSDRGEEVGLETELTTGLVHIVNDPRTQWSR